MAKGIMLTTHEKIYLRLTKISIKLTMIVSWVDKELGFG